MSTPRSHRLRVAAPFVSALLLLVGVEALGFWASARSEASERQVVETYETIAALEHLLARLVNLETGRRGFALTGDENQLSPYFTSLPEVRATLVRLGTTFRGTPSEAAFSELENRVDAQIRLLEAQIEARRTAPFDAAREAAGTARGKAAMDGIRANIARIESGQRERLERRKRREEEVRAIDLLARGAGSVVGLSVFAIAAWRLRREANRRREREQKLAATLLAIGDGVLVTDAQGVVTQVNRAAERITGRPATDAIGRPFGDVVDDGAEHLVRALREGRVETVREARLTTPSNEVHLVDQSLSPVRDADGTIAGAVAVLHDVTDLRAAERDLRRANAFLDSIVDNIPFLVVAKAADTHAYVYANRAALAIRNFRREDLIGKTDRDLLPEADAARVTDEDRGAFDHRGPFDVPDLHVETSSGEATLRRKKVPVFHDDGRPDFVLSLLEDVTEQRAAERALRTAKEAVEAANHELETFSYAVAHDLRAPLRSVDGFASALVEDYADKLDGEARDYLMRIRRAAGRMAELIDDLLALARMTRAEVDREPVDVTRLARTVGDALRETHGSRVDLVVADGLVANADPRLLRVALENLLSNAFKFSERREGARVEVGSARRPEGHVLFVRDNGVGFDRGAAIRLFEPFQRFHKPSDYDGTGVGLATVQRIVHRHGGSIWAESAEAAGATFFFSLEPSDDAVSESRP